MLFLYRGIIIFVTQQYPCDIRNSRLSFLGKTEKKMDGPIYIFTT